MRVPFAQLPASALARPLCRYAALAWLGAWTPAAFADAAPASDFHTQIQPILEEYCYDCHGDGAHKGNVAFDSFKSDQDVLDHRDLWFKALKNLRAGLMPPPKKSRPTPAENQKIERWIKAAVFKADPQNPDPGRVTVRRLNRVEYRNTIRDLMGVEYDTEKEFPADDAGYGFDNIGDVLTLPPMLLEKYFAAAKEIVEKAVPTSAKIPQEHTVNGRQFTGEVASKTDSTISLSYYREASVTNSFSAEHDGKFQLLLDFTATEKFVDNVFDYNKCRLVFKTDGAEVFQHEYTREGTRPFHYEFDREWQAGPHELVLEVHPLTPDKKQVRSLALRFDSVTVRGPLNPKYFVEPKNYAHFFPRNVPGDSSERQEYAREILTRFVTRAYRRPAQPATVDRLVRLTEGLYQDGGKTFEASVGQAMTAVLTSPRFLFREEGVELASDGNARPLSHYSFVDDYALASRLSYFLWASMPDDELLSLAQRHELRAHLDEQFTRMLADRKSEAFVRNFVGQWLQVRDMDHVQIDARQVLARENFNPDLDQKRTRLRELRAKEQKTPLTVEEKAEADTLRSQVFGRSNNRPPAAELTGDLRRAMRQETERTFEYVMREDRSLLELIDSNYTFLNEKLAKHYGLTNLNVHGDEMRLVTLPADSPRGGVITDGAVLTVTSNPTRTSPVKRGLFVLDNLLGTPPPPPPPDIPALEEAIKGVKDHTPTLRETLALHREAALCSSCHNRMDPLGLALENFNALGMWRERDRGQPIDATGQLLTGESFQNITELKHILVTQHADDFYRTITEKLLTYALGRGLEYYDVATVDGIVEALKASNGRASALLTGVVHSAPFQKTRLSLRSEQSNSKMPGTDPADTKNGL